MRVVAPFRPFAPESQAHQLLGPFDWVEALRMLRASVARSCACETWAITDVDTELPVPSLRYVTTHRRLMLWILEVSLRYLESSDFDQPTVMASPDVLVFSDLAPFVVEDLGVLVRRPKFQSAGKPLMNALQFWHPRAQDALVAFYRKALAIAEALPETAITWGADTIPLVQLLHPLSAGAVVTREGLRVACFSEERVMLSAFEDKPPTTPATDFKYTRKLFMKTYFERHFGPLTVQA